MIASVGTLREWADLDTQIMRIANGFPPMTKHQSFFLNDDFYFLKWKSVCYSKPHLLT